MAHRGVQLVEWSRLIVRRFTRLAVSHDTRRAEVEVGGEAEPIRRRPRSPRDACRARSATSPLGARPILYCYDKVLLNQPTLAGTGTITFVIETDGKVSSSAGAGLEADVDSCIATVIKNIEFPRPKSMEKVDVKYPFVFRSATVSH